MITGFPWRREDSLALTALSFWLGVYALGAATTIQPADNADFLTVVGIAGVAHPPGYPLYTLLGLLAKTIVPVPLPVLLSWLGAVCSLGILWGIYCAVRLLTHHRLAAFGAAMLAAPSLHLWKHATHGEVFALLGFFAVWLLVLAILIGDATQHESTRVHAGYVYALYAGLASSHHQVIIFTAPLGLWVLFRLFLSRRTRVQRRGRVFVLGLLLFLLGLTPYGYVWIKGQVSQPGSWASVQGTDTFLGHVTRRIYGTFRSGGDGKRLAPFGYHTKRYLEASLSPLGTFPFGGSLLWLMGFALVFSQIFRWRRLTFDYDGYDDGPGIWLALLLTWLAVGPFFLNLLHLGTSPIHKVTAARFFLLPDIFLAVFAGVGLASLIRAFAAWLERQTEAQETVETKELAGAEKEATETKEADAEAGQQLPLPVSIAVLLVVFWYVAGAAWQAPRAASKGKDWIERTLVEMLREQPKGGLLVAAGGDTVCFGLQYLQEVRGIRRDVRFICRPFLSQSWYIKQRAERWPELAKGWRAPVVTATTLMEHYLRLGRSVRLTRLFHPRLKERFTIMPWGVTYKILPRAHKMLAPEVIEAQMKQQFRKMRSQRPLPRSDWSPWHATLLQRHYAVPWMVLASLYRSKGKRKDAARCVRYTRLWPMLMGRARSKVQDSR